MSYDASIFNTTTTNWLSVASSVNEQSGYWFATLLLLAFFVASFVLFKKEEGVGDWLLPTFSTSIVGLLMFFAGLIHWSVVLFPIFGVIVVVMAMSFQ